MAVVLTYGASMPIVKMGRMAGQFAKPRSSDTETRGDVTLPAYRGDIVNGYDFTPESRAGRPGAAACRGYHTAASTLNLIRAFTQGGFADLRAGALVEQGLRGEPGEPAATSASRTRSTAPIKFMEAAGADFDELKRVEFYTGHEGLLMDYERPMTRIDSRTGTPYNTSAHFLWIGERTRDLDGAHVDYFSRDPQPDRREARPVDDARDDARSSSTSSTPTASPAASRSSRAWAPARSATRCRRCSRPIKRMRRDAALGHRPDARQRHHDADRLQDAPLRRRRRRGPRLLRGAPRRGHATRAASTSSSPATTSPSASAARSRSTRRPSRRATSRCATRA